MSDCIFCKIVKGEISGKFAYRDNEIVAIYDINPKAPVHVLVMPVKHLDSLIEVKKEDEELLGSLLLSVKKIAENLNIASSGYKIVINNGRASGQIVYHLHIHLLGGWREAAHWEV